MIEMSYVLIVVVITCVHTFSKMNCTSEMDVLLYVNYNSVRLIKTSSTHKIIAVIRRRVAGNMRAYDRKNSH